MFSLTIDTYWKSLFFIKGDQLELSCTANLYGIRRTSRRKSSNNWTWPDFSLNWNIFSLPSVESGIFMWPNTGKTSWRRLKTNNQNTLCWLVANWWTWKLLPSKIDGDSTKIWCKAGKFPWQPCEQEPALVAATNWHCHIEGTSVEVLVLNT